MVELRYDRKVLPEIQEYFTILIGQVIHLLMEVHSEQESLFNELISSY